MFKTVYADDFFSDNRPPGIPLDTDIANIDEPHDSIKTLDTSGFPLPALKDILIEGNKRIGAGQKAVESIQSIDNDTVFVVSGQQAGLFGGPLYTLYKAMHTVWLASILSHHTGRKVMPLFWVVSDDHDFQEVKSLGVRTNDGLPKRIEYTPVDYKDGSPVGSIIIDDGIFQSIDSLAKYCTPGEATNRYIDIISSAWQPGKAWSEAFSAQISNIFIEYGIIIFNPQWNNIKALFRDIMIAELSEPLATSTLVNEAAGRLETPKQRRRAIRKPAGATNLFLEQEGVRCPIIYGKKTFRAGNSKFSKEELLDLVHSSPERFSPGAVLRPICQDSILPVVAMISGPGERLYLKQIDPVYKHFNINRSIAWPRASFTIIDRRTMRTSEKEKVSLDKLFSDVNHIRLELARNTFPSEIKNKLESLESAGDRGFDSLAESIGSLDPTLVASIIKDKGKVLHIIREIKKRAVRAHKKTLDISENRLRSASYFLMPDGGAQERWFGTDAVISIFEGSGFDELLKLTSPGEERHRIVFPE